MRNSLKVKMMTSAILLIFCCSFTSEVEYSSSLLHVKHYEITYNSYKNNDSAPKGFTKLSFDVNKIMPSNSNLFYTIVTVNLTAASGTAANNLSVGTHYENNWLTHYVNLKLYLGTKATNSIFAQAGCTGNFIQYYYQYGGMSSFSNSTTNKFGINFGSNVVRIIGESSNTFASNYQLSYQMSYTQNDPVLSEGQISDATGYGWGFNFDRSKIGCRNAFNAQLTLILESEPYPDYEISETALGHQIKYDLSMDCHKDWFSGNTKSTRNNKTLVSYAL